MNSTLLPSSTIQPMFTVPEVAKLIHKAEWTTRRMARLNILPGARRVGNTWLFQRCAIEKFVTGGKA